MTRKTEQRRSLNKVIGKPAAFRLKPTCAALLLVFAAQSAQANPVGGVKISGQVDFATSGNTLTVTNTPGAVIHWQSFSIGANEVTRFVQQNAASTVLNRIITPNTPSEILGTLSSNGRVFLVNPGGVIFGKGATVDVAGLVATSLKLSDADFQAGRYNFTDVPGAQNVSNAGDITARGDGLAGGQIYLIAPDVKNTGVIKAPNGEILLAAGHEVQLVNSLDPHLRANITAPAGEATNVGTLVASSGSLGLFGAVVRNSGTASADSATMQGGKIVFKASQRVEAGGIISASGTGGGSISLSAEPSSDLDAPGVIAQTGSIRAQGATGAGGTVSLNGGSILSSAAITVDGAAAGGAIRVQATGRALSTASARYTANSARGQGGDILVSANLSNYTSGSYSAAGITGGRLTLAGNEIKLAGAQLDASGTNGGGTIHVGGLMHGAAGFGAQGVALANAGNVLVNSVTTLKADALQTGNGGQVVLWSDQAMRFNGSFSARGGASGGNGGFAEVSGLTSFGYGGTVDLSAPHGASGTLLLDPQNITIVPGSAALPASSFQEIIDPNIGAGEGFGGFQNLVLANGNIVIASPLDDLNATNSGAVYLYNSSGSLVSALVGSLANDNVGGVVSTNWPYGLIGGLKELVNGHVIVASENWGGTSGAVTWMDGMTGLLSDGVSVGGIVSATNSLVGAWAGDKVGHQVIEVANNKVLVVTPTWSNGGTAPDAGAVTWMDGSSGQLSGGAWGGQVSSTNSLVSNAEGDQVGSGGISWLTDNSTYWNYAIRSPLLGSGGVAASALGAVTWMNGATGELSNSTAGTPVFGGVLGAANSIVGSTPGDKVGTTTLTYVYYGTPYSNESSGIHVVSGNLVVASNTWNNGGTAANAGAVTWMNGATGELSNSTVAAPVYGGAVSASNSLVGSTANDKVGTITTSIWYGTTEASGLIWLPSGNYLVRSPDWNNGGTVANAGAITWGSGAAGVVGTVSGTNSLIGSTAGDQVGGGGVTLLGNGNYLVRSPNWNYNGAAANAGAVTWGSGTTGVIGTVSSANSIVGSHAGDGVGAGLVDAWTNDPGLVELPNNNYVVVSSRWNGGMGAVTWGDGTNGTSGIVSGIATTGNALSLVGAVGASYVGAQGIQVQAGGSNFVVKSPWFDSYGMLEMLDNGAITWVNGTTGALSNGTFGGAVDGTNSLMGGYAYDNVGAVTALNNGNFLATTPVWNGGSPSTGLGALTWMSGATGKLADGSNGGSVSSANSLVGSSGGDMSGNSLIQLSNNNLLLKNPNWNNGANQDVGALTWMNGATGELSNSTALAPVYGGVIGTANSLVGAYGGVLANLPYPPYSPYYAGREQIGEAGITELASGNVLVRTHTWHNPNTNADNAGAVTWLNGATGKLADGSAGGLISASNSLVGDVANSSVGNYNLLYLGNGNVVIRSSQWNNSAGAVTWMDGATGALSDGTSWGVISAANSLTGSTASDSVGSDGVTEVTDYASFWNYVVRSSNWRNGAEAYAGAITWVNGATGKTSNNSGVISSANSLVGSTAGDYVGQGSMLVSASGYAVFASSSWSGGKGAVTWMDTATGALAGGATDGTISGANSLVGSTSTLMAPPYTSGDQIGSGGISEITDDSTFSNYVVLSPGWNNGAVASAGAVTFNNGATGMVGVVSAANSLVGDAASDRVGSGGISTVSDGVNFWNYLVRSPDWRSAGGYLTGMGAVTWMDGQTGALATGAYGGAVGPVNSLVGSHSGDMIGTAGLYNSSGIIVLDNGNALVRSQYWNGYLSALTWMNGATGELSSSTVAAPVYGGAVSAANSLLGSLVDDDLGNGEVGVTTLANGNLVITSTDWGRGGVSANRKGAATWMESTTGKLADGSFGGVVSAANSLIGTGSAMGYLDLFCDCSFPNSVAGGVTALSDGNYVVYWQDASPDVGAVAWGNGTSGLAGTVGSNNSLMMFTESVQEMPGQNGTVLIGSGGANGGAGGVYLLGAGAGGGASGPLFADSPGVDANVGASWIASILNGGTNLVLQANNDLTQQQGAGITATGLGSLTLQAGRNVILDDAINIAGALNITANDAGADQNYRATGQAVIDVTLATLTAGQIALTNSGGDILAGTMTARSGALKLVAAGNIGVAAGAAITATAAGMGVILNADSDGLGDGAIRLNDSSSITSNGGDIMLGGGTAGDGTGNAAGNATYIDGIYLTGATLDAGGGNIALRGTGFDAPSANGVYLTSNNDGNGTIDSAIRTIGAGTITLNGDVAGGTGLFGNTGIRIGGGTSTLGSGASISSVDGLISLTGQGGASTGSLNMGVYVHNGATISATGTGSITLNGVGGGSGPGGSNRGVRVSTGAAIISNSGDIDITGTGAWNSDGLQVAGGSQLQSETGNITLDGTSGDGSNTDGTWIGETGTTVSSGGVLTIIGRSTATAGNGNHGVVIDTGASVSATGLMALTGYSGAGASGAVFLSGTDVVNAATGLSISGMGDVVVDTGSTINVGTGNANISTDRNILFAVNSSLAASAGAVNISLNPGNDGGIRGGIYLDTGSSLSSNGGSIQMGSASMRSLGNGTVTGGVTFNSGITVLGDITAGAGNVTMYGQGAAGFIPADGVALLGGTLSSDGTVTVDGIAQAWHANPGLAGGISDFVAGVHFANAGVRLATATGTVNVTGVNTAAGVRAQGVTVDGATIETTGTGTLTLNGTSTPVPDTNWGVGILNGGTVRTTAAGGGALTIIGSASPADGGIVLLGGNVTSGGGEIRMVSTSGAIGLANGAVVGGPGSGNILMKIGDSSPIVVGSGTINAGSGALTLSLAGGDVNDNNNSITAGALRLLGTGIYNLGGINNNVGTLAANVTGNVTYNDTDGFAIGSVTSFDGAAVTTTNGVTATGNALFNAGGAITTSGGVVTANSLSATAMGGIALATQVTNLTTSNTGAGNTDISNTGALTVNGMSDASGSITLNNAGSVSVVGGVSANGSALTNGIALSATGALSDITFSGQGGANTASGSISLNAGQDIIHTGGAQQINSSSGAVTLAAGRDITHTGGAQQINSSSGAMLLNAGRDILHTGSTTSQINTFSGAMTLMAGRDIVHTDASQINSYSGAMLLSAGRDIVHSGSASQINNNGGSLTITAGQDFIHSASNQINTNSGALNITASRDFLHNASGQINTSSGTMTLDVGGNFLYTGSGQINAASSAQTITVGGNLDVAGASSQIRSGGNQAVSAGRDISVGPSGGLIAATGMQAITAGRDLSVIQNNGSAYVESGGLQTITVGRNLLVQVTNSSGAEAHIEGGAGQNITVGGNLTLNALDNDQTRINANGGNQTITVGGNMTLNAAQDIAHVQSLAGTQTVMVSGNSSLTGGGAYMAGSLGQAIVVGGNLDVTRGGMFSGGSAALQIGNGLTLSDGARVWSNGPLQGSVGGNLTITGGISGDAGLFGTPDIGSVANPFSVGGTIRMDDGAYGGAKIHSGTPYSIWIHFPNLTSGGYFVNGTEEVSSGMSGFYADGLPAVLDSNLHITYMPLAIISQPVLDFIARSSLPQFPGIPGLPANAVQPPNINLLLQAAPPGAGDKREQDDPALAALAAAAPGTDPAAPPPPLPVCK